MIKGFLQLMREVITGESAAVSSGSIPAGSYAQNIVSVNTPTAAMKLAAVFRAVELTSEGVACMPLHVKRYNRAQGVYQPFDPAKAAEREGAHIDYLLSVKPNERMTAYQLKKNTVSLMRLWGNALWVPVREYGSIKAIYLIAPGCWSYDAIHNVYNVMDAVNCIHDTFEADEVMHFKNVCMDGGYYGISTISMARETLSTVATADAETQKRFATGGRFKAILTNDNSVKGFGEYQDEELKKLAKSINSSVQSGDDIIFMPGDGHLQQMSMSSADLEFLQSRVFGIREIARFFGVPLSKLMEVTNANYKSVEMEQMDFYAETLQPLREEIENQIRAKLTTFETYLDYKVSFDPTNLFAMDLTGKAAWNKARLETGTATVNDLRREMDMRPVEAGDEVLMSANLKSITMLKAEGEAEAKNLGDQGGQPAAAAEDESGNNGDNK